MLVCYSPGWSVTCSTFCSQASVLPSICFHLCLQYVIHMLLDVPDDHRCTWALGHSTINSMWLHQCSALQAYRDVNFELCVSQTPAKSNCSWEPRLWNKLINKVDSVAMVRICFVLCLLSLVNLEMLSMADLLLLTVFLYFVPPLVFSLGII